VDSVLSSLLETYALLVGGGVLLAGVLGTLIARSALAPITRFSERTEHVTSTLSSPRRLQGAPNEHTEAIALDNRREGRRPRPPTFPGDRVRARA
jgi:hypothetical protein